MKIRELQIRGFGKFQNVRWSLGEGINVIAGENESGKTTLHVFLRSMFFGLRRQRGRASRNDSYSRYEPWENPGAYGGSLRFESGGKEFRLLRSFSRGQAGGQLVCESDGECLSLEHGDLEMLLGGIREAVFDNTVSVGQLKSVTGKELSRELGNYMANYQGSIDGSLDLKKAEEVLKDRRKNLEAVRKERKSRQEAEQQAMLSRCAYLRQECERLREDLGRAEDQWKQRENSGKTEEKKKRGGNILPALTVLSVLLALGSVFLLREVSFGLRLLPAACFLVLAGLAAYSLRARKAKRAVPEAWEEQREKLAWSTEYLRRELGEKEKAARNAEQEYREYCGLCETKDPLETDLAAVRLAEQVICRLSEELRRKVGNRLKERTAALLREITGGKYRMVSLDGAMNITLYTGESSIPLSRVSRGTMEQVYLALRMASAELLCPEEELPLFLDEAFALYDDRRLSQTLRALAASGRQVLLFTCQGREEQLLKQMNIPYHKIFLQEESV